MNLCTIDVWETPHTTTDHNIFFPDDQRRRVHCISPRDETSHSQGELRRIHLLPTPSPLSPPCKMKSKLEMGMSFTKRGGVSQHVCKACGQRIPPTKDITGPSTEDKNSTNNKTVHIHANKLINSFVAQYFIKTLRSGYVSFLSIHVMYEARIPYV